MTYGREAAVTSRRHHRRSPACVGCCGGSADSSRRYSRGWRRTGRWRWWCSAPPPATAAPLCAKMKTVSTHTEQIFHVIWWGLHERNRCTQVRILRAHETEIRSPITHVQGVIRVCKCNIIFAFVQERLNTHVHLFMYMYIHVHYMYRVHVGSVSVTVKAT